MTGPMTNPALFRAALVSWFVALLVGCLPPGDELGEFDQHSGLPPLATLAPGELPSLHRSVPVNIVFLGYRQGTGSQDIDEAKFRQLLRPFAATPALDDHGNLHSLLSFHFDFNLVYAPAWYE